MRKINVAINKIESDLLITNSDGIRVVVTNESGTLKASEVFKLFDNGLDVVYECTTQKIEPIDGQNLNRLDLLFNDCLELINSIIASLNQKIDELNNCENKGDNLEVDKE